MPSSWYPFVVPDYVIGKPISFEEWRGAIENPKAIAEGASGAPRVVVPTALSTAETNTNLVLSPNGSGGLVFRSQTPAVMLHHESDSGVQSFWSGDPVDKWLGNVTIDTGGANIDIRASVQSVSATAETVVGDVFYLVKNSGVIQSNQFAQAVNTANFSLIVGMASATVLQYGVKRNFGSGTKDFRLKVYLRGVTASL